MSLAHIVGSINRDIVATLDRHPKPGETVLGTTVTQFPGGKGANQAVAIARLGGAARMIGRIGFDAYGSEMVKFLKGEGVDVAFVKAIETTATGIAIITVDGRGENAIVVIPGANHVWSGGLGEIHPRAGDIVVCQLEVPMAIVQAAFLQAKEIGARTVLNPAPWQALPDRLLALTDVLILNETELAAEASARAPDRPAIDTRSLMALKASAGALAARGPRHVIVTLGGSGAFVHETDGGYRAVPGRAVRAIDTTGAGDCFVGAFVAELLRGSVAHDAIAFANRAAALSVTRRGAAASFPTRAEVAAAQ
jgi:ribokinase